MSTSDAARVFEQLLERNRGRLIAIARAYADGDKEDLLQEILLQIWRSLPGFDDRSHVDTWCYRIALNTAISWRRKSGRRRQRLPAAATDVQQLTGGRRELDVLSLVERFLQTVNDVDRAIVLMYLEDLSHSDMADALGMRVGAIRVRVHRIKQRLAEWVSNHEPG